MKRQVLIRHIELHGCILLREGSKHSIYFNPANQKQSAVGRHKELSDILCLKVCKQLDIAPVKK
jgi:mRNA interferase HicA